MRAIAVQSTCRYCFPHPVISMSCSDPTGSVHRVLLRLPLSLCFAIRKDSQGNHKQSRSPRPLPFARIFSYAGATTGWGCRVATRCENARTHSFADVEGKSFFQLLRYSRNRSANVPREGGAGFSPLLAWWLQSNPLVRCPMAWSR